MKAAVVLLSGGLDSATTLAIARTRGYACHALSFDYGQRHRIELTFAQRLAHSLGAVDHRVIHLGLDAIGGSALTDPRLAIPHLPANGIPITYVPARNTIFLALALGYAETLESSDIFIGVNALDYSGYPDCRPEFIAQFTQLANVATKHGVEGGRFQIHAPLLHWTKAQIITEGSRLGVDFAQTLSCYDPDTQGQACGICDACRLRRHGFKEAQSNDPTLYQKGTS